MSLMAVIHSLVAVITRLTGKPTRLMKIKELEPRIDRIGLEKLNVILEHGQIKYFVCWDAENKNIVVFDREGIAWSSIKKIEKPENINDLKIEKKRLEYNTYIGECHIDILIINGEEAAIIKEYCASGFDF